MDLGILHNYINYYRLACLAIINIYELSDFFTTKQIKKKTPKISKLISSRSFNNTKKKV